MYVRSLSTNAPVDQLLASLRLDSGFVEGPSGGLRPVSGPAAPAKPGHDKNLILIPRVKLGMGPAISVSVSSVFKELRRHFRFGVSARVEAGAAASLGWMAGALARPRRGHRLRPRRRSSPGVVGFEAG